MSEGWCLIESDPGVFTELMEKMGVIGLQVEEVYSLDEFSVQELKPIYALIFLFKWQKNEASYSENYSDKETIYFSKQVIHNACATMAILNIVMNLEEKHLNPQLIEFKEFTKDFDSETKGLAIGGNDQIRLVHNSFSRPEAFFNDGSSRQATEKDDVFHFTAFVPIKGRLYELDGLKPAPVDCGKKSLYRFMFPGECLSEDWITKASEIIMERTGKYAESEIRFSLMAVVKNRMEALKQELKQCQDELFSSSDDERRSELLQVKADLLERISVEERKRDIFMKENQRRKHNYFPMIMEILKYMAAKEKF